MSVFDGIEYNDLEEKMEVGTGDKIEIDNSKEASVSGSWGSVSKSKLMRDVMKASNYKSVAKECYLIVEEGFEDTPSQKLHYPHHVIKDGKLVVHEGGCKAALSFLNKSSTRSNAAAYRHLRKHYNELGLNTDDFPKEYVQDNITVTESISDGKLRIVESCTVRTNIDPESTKKVVKEAKEKGKRMVLKPRIEAIHSGRTRNHNIYLSEKLKGDRTYRDPQSGKLMPTGVYSFTMPYPKPMLIDHDPQADNVTGRITNAQFVRDSLTGRDTIVIIPEITSEDAIEKILDGRYLTVSVGCSTDSAICNICGKDIINEGFCEHTKGEEYDGVVCGWILGNIWFDECSWVAVPADTDARVLDTGEASVIEAYIEVDNDFYDLSNGASKITEAVASTLGLVESKERPKGGSNTVDKKVENTVSVEEFNAVKDKVATLENTITEKDNKIKELEGVIAEKDAALAEKDTKIATLEEEKNELTSKVATLETKVGELEAERQALVNQNAEMAAKAHKDLVERVVDFKIALGKPGVENREEAIAEHSARSSESLMDSYRDLLAELTSRNNMFISERLTRPGIGALDDELNSTIEGVSKGDKNDKINSLSVEQIMKNLLSGHLEK